MHNFEKENSQNAFLAFMSLGADKVNSFNSQEYIKVKVASYGENYSGFEKIASMTIPLYNPTSDSIEDFVRNHIKDTNKSVFGFNNEKIGFEPDIQVNFTPSAYEGEHSETVTEGTGLAILTVGQFNIELPFLIHEKGFQPFDIIQLNGERMPFSQENLYKLILACVKKQKQLEEEANGTMINNENFSPYLKTQDKLNPTTSTGFLGNALAVQERYRIGSSNFAESYVQAAEIHQGLEKLATMNEFDFGVIKDIFEENALKTNSVASESIEKIANDLDSTKKQNNIMDKFYDMPWIDVFDVKNNEYIKFPEFKNGNELTMTDAIVVRKFSNTTKDLPKSMYAKRFIDGSLMVLTRDGRVRCFTPGQHMLCMRQENAPGKFKSSTISKVLNCSETPRDSYLDNSKPKFIAFIDGRMTMPLKMNYSSTTTIGGTNSKSKAGKAEITKYEISGCDMAGLYFNEEAANKYFNGETYRHWSTSLRLFLSDEVTGVVPVTKAELIELLKKQTMVSENEIERLISTGSHCRYFAANPEQKVLIITGLLTTFFKDRKELNFVLQNKQNVENDMMFLKTAMQNEYVRIECRDKNAGLYTISLSYIDKTKRMFSSRVKTLERQPLSNIRGILFAIGFDQNRVQELCYIAKREGSIQAELPSKFNPDKMDGAASKSQALLSFNKAKKKVFGNNFVQKAAQDALATALTDTPLAKNRGIRNIVLGETQKHASTCLDLANRFEKMAKIKESELMQKTAEAMALGHHLFTKTAEIIEEKKEYPQILSVCEKVAHSRDYLSSLATNLIMTKVAEVIDNVYDVEPETFGMAAKELDSIYSLSCEYLEKSAAENEDDRPLTQKVVTGGNKDSNLQQALQQDVLEKVKENEKEKTPGGKATPTVLVRRKNKHRMLQ